MRKILVYTIWGRRDVRSIHRTRLGEAAPDSAGSGETRPGSFDPSLMEKGTFPGRAVKRLDGQPEIIRLGLAGSIGSKVPGTSPASSSVQESSWVFTRHRPRVN